MLDVSSSLKRGVKSCVLSGVELCLVPSSEVLVNDVVTSVVSKGFALIVEPVRGASCILCWPVTSVLFRLTNCSHCHIVWICSHLEDSLESVVFV